MVRRGKDELLAELNRFWDILDASWACRSELHDTFDPELAEVLTYRPSRQSFLSVAGNGQATMSQLLAGVRQAINDESEKWGLHETRPGPEASAFLTFYEGKTGRAYFEDAGNPRKLARRIPGRGEIVNETEYDLVLGISSNVDQTVFKGQHIDRINEMMGSFELERGND
jgi:malate synthase